MANELGVRQKIASALKDSSYDALLLVGSDNVAWATGVVFPFAPYMFSEKIACFCTKDREPVCVCPAQLASSMTKLGFSGRLISYELFGNSSSTFVDALVGVLREAGSSLKELGYDANHMSVALFQSLKSQLPALQWVDANEWVAGLRKIKTQQEQDRLEEAAYRTDHGINGQFHHAMSARFATLMGIAENVRVHCMERFLDEAGYNSVARMIGSRLPGRFFPFDEINGFNYGFCEMSKAVTGQMYSVSMNAALDGYWATDSRILSYGDFSERQRQDYEQINQLRNMLLAAIKPGAKCGEVFDSVRQLAVKQGIRLVPGIGFGHGVGVSVQEAPYLTEDSQEILETGMVLILDQAVYGENGEILRSKDTVILTAKGCRIVNWWKDWSVPYFPIEFL